MSQGSLYPTYFADHGRSSFVPAKLACQGRLIWNKEIAFPDSSRARYVLILDDILIVETLTALVAVDQDGNVLWNRLKAHGGAAEVANGLLYFQNTEYGLDAVDKDNNLARDDDYLPEAPDEDHNVALFAPQADVYYLVSQYNGGMEYTPEVRLHMTRFGDRISTWDHFWPGTQRVNPLYLAATGQIVVFSDSVIVFEAGTGKEMKRFAYPLAEPINCSAGRDGVLYMLGKDKGATALLAFDAAGQEKWRLVDPGSFPQPVQAQPPVIGDQDLVYVLNTHSVAAVRRGLAEWAFRPEGGQLMYATSFLEGRLLLVAGNFLFCIGPDGGVNWEIELPAKILTSPVVTPENRVFLVAGNNLIRLE